MLAVGELAATRSGVSTELDSTTLGASDSGCCPLGSGGAIAFVVLCISLVRFVCGRWGLTICHCGDAV